MHTWFHLHCTKRGCKVNRFGPYFVDPIIAGINADGTPFISSMDLIGCLNFAKDFCVAGTAQDMLYGMCESLWEPNLVNILIGTGRFV